MSGLDGQNGIPVASRAVSSIRSASRVAKKGFETRAAQWPRISHAALVQHLRSISRNLGVADPREAGADLSGIGQARCGSPRAPGRPFHLDTRRKEISLG
jgi:hypothetical protein